MSAPFTATPAELSLVNQIFAHVDKQKRGVLNGDVAVRVFSGAKLPGPVLGEIWSISDEENNGWLSKTGAAKALRLIGHAQKGTKVSATLLAKRQFPSNCLLACLLTCAHSGPTCSYRGL